MDSLKKAIGFFVLILREGSIVNYKSMLVGLSMLMFMTTVWANNFQGVAKESTTLVGSCMISNISVRYTLTMLSGQPVVRGSMLYDGDCRLPRNTKLLLRISNNNGAGGFIQLGMIASADGKLNGYKIVGPKKWGRLFCRDRFCNLYLSTTEARNIFSKGSDYQVNFYELRID